MSRGFTCQKATKRGICLDCSQPYEIGEPVVLCNWQVTSRPRHLRCFEPPVEDDADDYGDCLG